MNSNKKLESRYQSIVELAPDVVYTISKHGILTSLSSAFERITGWKRRDWVGKNFAGIVHPADLPRAFKSFRKTLKGEVVNYYTLRVRTKKGKYIVGEFKSAPDVINGKIVGVIGIGRDVTQEQKEREEREHYRDLVQSADSAIISRDFDGVILTWNKGSEKLFGYTAKEVVGKNFSILIPEENRDELKKIDSKLRRGRPIEYYETVRVKKNGDKIHIVAKISPIFDSKGKIVGASLFDRDNTAAKHEREKKDYLARASKILSSSLDYSQTLGDIANMLIPDLADWSTVHIFKDSELERVTVAHRDPKKVKWAVNLQKIYGGVGNDPNNGTARVARTGKSEIYPIVTDEVLDKAIQNKKIKGLIKRLKLRSVMIVPLLSGKKVLGVISLISTDKKRQYDEGDLRFAEELGRLAGQAVDNSILYYEAQREIAKRRDVEAALIQSRDELSIILANIVDGITVQDDKGRLVYANDAAALASGYGSVRDMLENPNKWISKFELTDERGEQFDLNNLPGRRAVRGEISPSATIRFVNRASGEEHWSVVKARPVLDENGKLKAVVNIISDITESKELERRKDDFISIASHELKTPVTSIKGFTHLLKRQHADYQESKSYAYINKIDSQLKNLTELIDDLLDISRLQSGKLTYRVEEFNIADVVHEAVEDLSAISDRHKIIVKNGASGIVRGDKDRIMQVLVNLLTNAIKYSPKSEKINVHLKRKKSFIEISVRDYGIGIEKDEIDKIFDRFYRVKDTQGKTFPGLGIGLHISKEIALRHKGNISVESEKGKGSLFRFTLPLAERRAVNN